MKSVGDKIYNIYFPIHPFLSKSISIDLFFMLISSYFNQKVFYRREILFIALDFAPLIRIHWKCVFITFSSLSFESLLDFAAAVDSQVDMNAVHIGSFFAR